MNPIVIFARILFAPLILKWPLFGGILAVFLDNIDWYTKNLFGISSVGEYQIIDKMLDTLYLSFLFIITLRFKNKIVRNILIFLFFYRLIGAILFVATQAQILLFIFPNIFEIFFFFYYILQKIAEREPKIPLALLGLFLALVSFSGIIQEYTIHISHKNLPTEIQVIYIAGLAGLSGFLFRKEVRN
ncbi:MAG: hypothetical protein Q7R51_01215 [bacterium]|nr:hypothetical protein [bacterium]